MNKLLCKITAMCLCIMMLFSCSHQENTVSKNGESGNMNVEAGNNNSKTAGSNKLAIWGYDPAWFEFEAELKKSFLI